MSSAAAFRLFLTSRAVSWAGSAMTLVALPLLLYQRTGSATLAGVLAGLEAVPYLLLGLLAGALVDRWDHRRTMVCTSVLSGLTMASIPIAHWTGLLTTAHLLVAAVLISTIFVFFDAAGFGAVPALVGRDAVASATGSMVAVSTLVNLVGPAIGGVAATTLGAANVLAVDAASYLLGAALLSQVRWTVTTTIEAPESTRGRLVRMRADIGEGLRYLWGHQVVRTLTLLGAGNSVSGGAVSGLLVVRQFGLPDDDARIGFLYVAAAGGSLLTSLLLGRVHRRFPVGIITLGALAVGWGALIGWSFATTWTVGLAVVVLWQASSSLAILNGIVVRQAVTPLRLQGRVNTTARMIAWGGTPLGAVLGGAVAEAWGTRTALLLASAGVGGSLVLGVVAGLRTVGRLRELPRDEDDAALAAAGHADTGTAPAANSSRGTPVS
ncbi:MFS transporter [Frankia sp. AgPm24]|uniref:MFS transporter n=1 Tax=Frankia sp. AgPm24 TaxID=631128 RepID=UPI00200E5CE2|nr:MFS transporter [Frankia sp. AgPm24]MCK9921750.1 MFS transporter [Frankia sp. AgPm24]